ncbi:MAG: DoxX family protein [Sphingobacteriaceae bacterium]
MKPLIVLVVIFSVGLLVTRLVKGKADVRLSGQIGLSGMLLFTAMGHFLFTQGMSMMLPEWIPLRIELVYITGIIEIIAAATILNSRYRKLTGICLMIFFVLILPANILAATSNLNYETGSYNGAGLNYLWFRIPFQLLLLAWTYYFAVRQVKVPM